MSAIRHDHLSRIFILNCDRCIISCLFIVYFQDFFCFSFLRQKIKYFLEAYGDFEDYEKGVVYKGKESKEMQNSKYLYLF